MSPCLLASQSASTQQHKRRHHLRSMQIHHQLASGTTPHPAHTLTTGAILFLMLAGATALPRAPSCRPCLSEHSPQELQRSLNVPQPPPRLQQVKHLSGMTPRAPPDPPAPCLLPHLPLPGPLSHWVHPQTALLQCPRQAATFQVIRHDPRRSIA